MLRHLVFNIVNNAPPMIAISAQRAGGKRKDTAINIENGQSFVVHVTDEDNVEKLIRPLHLSILKIMNLI